MQINIPGSILMTLIAERIPFCVIRACKGKERGQELTNSKCDNACNTCSPLFTLLQNIVAKYSSTCTCNLQNNIFLFFCHARLCLFSATYAVTVVLLYMHFCVSKFKHHGLFCYFITCTVKPV